MKRTSSRIATIAAVALVCALGTAPAANASITGVEVGGHLKRGGAQTYLNPVTIGLCNSGFGDVSVQRMDAKGLGAIDLFCGDANSGYVHIRSRHQADWQGVINSTHGGSANWDDVMVAFTDESVRAPAIGYPKNIGSNKWCYSAPIKVHDPVTGANVTFNPTVIVSTNNKKVITSFPTKSAANCNGS